MIVAIAEDEDSKRGKLRAFVEERFPGVTIIETKSVRGTTKALKKTNVDLLLLDMSLPTFDIAAGEPGGRPQGFGGIEVVRYLERDEVRIPLIVVTAHPAISKDGELYDVSAIGQMVEAETPNNYRGLVYFNTLTGAWRGQLLEMINLALKSRE